MATNHAQQLLLNNTALLDIGSLATSAGAPAPLIGEFTGLTNHLGMSLKTTHLAASTTTVPALQSYQLYHPQATQPMPLPGTSPPAALPASSQTSDLVKAKGSKSSTKHGKNNIQTSLQVKPQPTQLQQNVSPILQPYLQQQPPSQSDVENVLNDGEEVEKLNMRNLVISSEQLQLLQQQQAQQLHLQQQQMQASQEMQQQQSFIFSDFSPNFNLRKPVSLPECFADAIAMMPGACNPNLTTEGTQTTHTFPIIDPVSVSQALILQQQHLQQLQNRIGKGNAVEPNKPNNGGTAEKLNKGTKNKNSKQQLEMVTQSPLPLQQQAHQQAQQQVQLLTPQQLAKFQVAATSSCDLTRGIGNISFETAAGVLALSGINTTYPVNLTVPQGNIPLLPSSCGNIAFSRSTSLDEGLMVATPARALDTLGEMMAGSANQLPGTSQIATAHQAITASHCLDGGLVSTSTADMGARMGLTVPAIQDPGPVSTVTSALTPFSLPFHSLNTVAITTQNPPISGSLVGNVGFITPQIPPQPLPQPQPPQQQVQQQQQSTMQQQQPQQCNVKDTQETERVPNFIPLSILDQYPPLDLNSETDSNHDTALTLACAGGHEELVNLLLSHGSDIEHRDKKGFTPLMLAATAGHAGVVEILLTHGADIEAQSERTKDTALSLACSGGRYEVVDILLQKSANKEHRNVSDYTPLSLAASGGYVNIIKLLLSSGAEINSRTGSKLGISPLMLAAMNGHTAAVKLLLDMGSDINAQIETNRNTALTLACFQGRHEVVSLLLDRKANVEHRAKTGLTPLMEAASGGYVEVGRVLLDKGADVNAPPVPSSRDTALTIASDKGHYRFVELLLSKGASVDVKNKKGNSPLWLAANGGHLDVVQLLVNTGADIDSQDNRKISCLMAAFRRGHAKVVKYMVKHVTQFPSDQEMTRYIATINDKELLKKCHQCTEVLRLAKERQAVEANKNASILLEELDMEKSREENRKAAAARRRERKRKKKKERQEQLRAAKEAADGDGKCKDNHSGNQSSHSEDEDTDDEDDDDEDEDEKEERDNSANKKLVTLKNLNNKNSLSGNAGPNKSHSNIPCNMPVSIPVSETHASVSSVNVTSNSTTSTNLITSNSNKQKNKLVNHVDKSSIEVNKIETKKIEPKSSEKSTINKVTSSVVSVIIPNPSFVEDKRIKEKNHGKDRKRVKPSLLETSQKVDSTNTNPRSGGSSSAGTSTLITNSIDIHRNIKTKSKQEVAVSSPTVTSTTTTVSNVEVHQSTAPVSIPSMSASSTASLSNISPISFQLPKPSLQRSNVKNSGQKTSSSKVISASNILGAIAKNEKVKEDKTDKLSSNLSSLTNTFQGLDLDSPSNYCPANSSSLQALKSPVTFVNSRKNQKREEGWKEVVRRRQTTSRAEIAYTNAPRKVSVPSNAISRVIGRGGCNINAIREVSGANIEVEKQKGQGDRNIIIRGSSEAVKQAHQLISTLIKEPDNEIQEVLAKVGVSRPESVGKDSSIRGSSKLSSSSSATQIGSSLTKISSSRQILPVKSLGSVTSSKPFMPIPSLPVTAAPPFSQIIPLTLTNLPLHHPGSDSHNSLAPFSRNTQLIRHSSSDLLKHNPESVDNVSQISDKHPFPGNRNALVNKQSKSQSNSTTSTKTTVSYTMAVIAQGKSTKTVPAVSTALSTRMVASEQESSSKMQEQLHPIAKSNSTPSVLPSSSSVNHTSKQGGTSPGQNQYSCSDSPDNVGSMGGSAFPKQQQQTQISQSASSNKSNQDHSISSSRSISNVPPPEYSPFNNIFSKVAQPSVWGQKDSKETKPNFASVAAVGVTSVASSFQNSNSSQSSYSLSSSPSSETNHLLTAAKAPGYRGNLSVAVCTCSVTTRHSGTISNTSFVHITSESASVIGSVSSLSPSHNSNNVSRQDNSVNEKFGGGYEDRNLNSGMTDMKSHHEIVAARLAEKHYGTQDVQMHSGAGQGQSQQSLMSKVPGYNPSGAMKHQDMLNHYMQQHAYNQQNNNQENIDNGSGGSIDGNSSGMPIVQSNLNPNAPDFSSRAPVMMGMRMTRHSPLSTPNHQQQVPQHPRLPNLSQPFIEASNNYRPNATGMNLPFPQLSGMVQPPSSSQNLGNFLYPHPFPPAPSQSGPQPAQQQVPNHQPNEFNPIGNSPAIGPSLPPNLGGINMPHPLSEAHLRFTNYLSNYQQMQNLAQNNMGNMDGGSGFVQGEEFVARPGHQNSPQQMNSNPAGRDDNAVASNSSSNNSRAYQMVMEQAAMNEDDKKLPRPIGTERALKKAPMNNMADGQGLWAFNSIGTTHMKGGGDWVGSNPQGRILLGGPQQMGHADLIPPLMSNNVGNNFVRDGCDIHFLSSSSTGNIPNFMNGMLPPQMPQHMYSASGNSNSGGPQPVGTPHPMAGNNSGTENVEDIWNKVAMKSAIGEVPPPPPPSADDYRLPWSWTPRQT